MGITEQLARFATESQGDFLTPQLIESAKHKFIDTLGIMVAGAHAPAGRIALQSARETGGTAEATIIGWPDRTSMSLAGFVNGISAHALEYDDLTIVVGHASVCLVPGCLAVAESLNLSGKALIEAFVIGFEVAARVGKGLQPFILERGWHPTGIIGAQGVAAASCRMLGMDQMSARMAMGIAASSVSGVRKNIGSMGKAYHVGNGVRSGIFAAVMARRGFKVDADIIEGSDEGGNQRYGLADTFNGIGNYRLDQMDQGLGDSFELSRNTTLVRMHPGSTPPGAAIDGIIDLAVQHALDPSDVAEMRIECHPKMLAIGSYAEPVDEYKAKFCLPYIFAVAFIDRKVGLAQYSADKIGDPRIRDFMRCIKISSREDVHQPVNEDHGNTLTWGQVKITAILKSGAVIEQHAAYARGWPQRPATWTDLCGKYEDCTQGILARSQIADTIAILDDLDNLSSVRELTRALTPTKTA